MRWAPTISVVHARVIFLGPDPTRQNVLTRPAIADKKSDPTRPAAQPFPHMCIL